jgi:hypothetical protein
MPVPSHDCVSGKEAPITFTASPSWPSGLPKDLRIVSKVKPLAIIPRTTSAVNRNRSHRMPIVRRAIGLKLESHLRRTAAQVTQQKATKATINGLYTATVANGSIAGLGKKAKSPQHETSTIRQDEICPRRLDNEHVCLSARARVRDDDDGLRSPAPMPRLLGRLRFELE